MAIGYNPTFSQYYGGTGGNASFTGMVWDATGARVNTTTPINVDARSYYYNGNTGDIELVTFNAVAGGAGLGLYQMGLDGSGFFTGTNTQLLPSLPGLNGAQTMPAYDGARNRFYSRSTDGTVNIVNRSDGALAGTINLDLGSAGNPTLQSQFIGYDADVDVLITLDSDNVRAVVFGLDGSFLGTSQLANFSPTQQNFNAGYANGQIFVFDDDVFHGFQVVVVPEPATFVVIGIGIAALALRRKR
jgi:hypothetical protein